MERDFLPFASADRAKAVSMLNTIANAAEVESMAAFSSEDGLTIPSFHTPKANGTCSL